MSRAKYQSNQTVRRLKSATVRIENEPYGYVAQTRAPRLTGWSGAFFIQTPSSGLAGASGTWPSLTAAAPFTSDVYNAQGTALVLVAASAKIYNWFPATPNPSKVTMVFPDGAGNWIVGPQSCT